MDWESCGQRFGLNPGEPFLAAIPKEAWGEAEEEHSAGAAEAGKWDPTYGDRASELVCIGLRFDVAALREALDAACVTDEELAGGPELWRTFDDPFFNGQAQESFFEVSLDQLFGEECE
jgi:hypothetical protein